MGNTLDATGKPTYSSTPLQTVADLQAGVGYTEKVGGLLKVTASQRGALLSSQVKPGWLISETDTGRLYVSTVGTPQGELIHTPETTASVAWGTSGSTTFSSWSSSPVTIRSKNGRVNLEGVAVSTSATFDPGTSYTLGTVPEGYRPDKEQVFAVPAYAMVLARLLVQPGGALIFQVASTFTAPLAMGLAGVGWKVA